MRVDHSIRYESADDFYDPSGNVIMRLTTEAALDVCARAAGYDLIVVRIEGGIWHFPGIEARLDCIWDGYDPPISREGAEENNRLGADYIRLKSKVYDVFIIMAAPITGYRHTRATSAQAIPPTASGGNRADPAK